VSRWDKIPVLGGLRARGQALTDLTERVEELELGAAENSALATDLAAYVDGLERDVVTVLRARLAESAPED
jgi:hypothetical protein